ncbi:hydroxymethylbilane synthase [Sphingomonas sp.]|jgi:hydroxymethylbilane synthase|uniref:hydroxymethylbilane synthase n=1 Tax=Sphingomonas sp. TaxID=28214 RepID=UPI002D7FD841|nr:hydroxymethylbilane synthase [Sphingomonas sp.]HEU0045617.1 hydroxymethylbilane synthase [Sphingomonas sp.]
MFFRAARRCHHLMNRIRLGTRGSPLALVQANIVRDALIAAHAVDVEIVVIRTTGDVVQDRPLAEIGGKALWTKELDRALLGGAIDCAVHSMKDVETIRPTAIAIVAMLPRADVRDRLIGAASIADLPQGATVGTSSPRRRAQLLRLRPDLHVVSFRGNVDTRLARLAAGEADATLLAAAGLARLGRPDVGTAIELDIMLPAPAQGAVGIEARSDDAGFRAMLGVLDHAPTHAAVLTERALLAALHAGCHSPVAALAGDDGLIRAELFTEDGRDHVAGTGDDPAELARDLLARAPHTVRELFAA